MGVGVWGNGGWEGVWGRVGVVGVGEEEVAIHDTNNTELRKVQSHVHQNAHV